MTSSREGKVALVVGSVGLVLTVVRLLPPLADSLVLGLPLGAILIGPLGRLANLATAPSTKPQPPEARLGRIVMKRRAAAEAEFATALERFDSLISRVGEVKDPGRKKEVSQSFRSEVDNLTSHSPVWDPEGKLRTHVTLQKIAESMDLQSIDEHLDLACSMLVARGDEAAQLSRITLNGKVEKIYREPWSENARRLAGTLLLMNRGDELYAESMVVDAIHLWSETRFGKLEEDFAAIPALGPKSVESILGLLDKEAGKARRAKDEDALQRALRLKARILTASNGPAH
ncbi:MAG: hypothetical protein JRN06_03035 [Nitrososphaerota archaeon]|nr:hypothetical protein [Nitrososphaerota archaeon]MDG7023167.1 hypothetical protein [Nitrososphaerota archaeon]